MLGFGGGWGGLCFGGGRAGLDDVDVLAGGGAGEQDPFQGDGAKNAAVQVGEDGREVGGAEVEWWRGDPARDRAGRRTARRARLILWII